MRTGSKCLSKAAAGTGTILGAPAVHAQSKIPWPLQTYAGPALAEHVFKPAIGSFDKIVGDEMETELFFADQLVPTGELFRVLQRGTIDSVQCDDDSMASPTDLCVFGGYFPFAMRYSLDAPVLFNRYRLGEIWDEESPSSASSGLPPAPGIPRLRDQGPYPEPRGFEGQARLYFSDGRALACGTNYFPTNNISGAWTGSFFANMER